MLKIPQKLVDDLFFLFTDSPGSPVFAGPFAYCAVVTDYAEFSTGEQRVRVIGAEVASGCS